MGDDRKDFDHAIPVTDDAAPLREVELGLPEDDRPTLATPADAGTVADVKQQVKDNAGKLGQQATDRIRAFADDGKARAGNALDQLSQMLTDAAGQVDEKLGAQYGQYARQAATTVQGFSDQVREKDVDALVGDVRNLVRASPGVAIGAAAAVGFVLARLIQSGLDERA